MRCLILCCQVLTLFFTPVIFAYAKSPQSIAFYYNKIDSVRELINYQRVVVTPSLIDDKHISQLHQAGTQVYAYLSVGEYDQAVPDNLSSAVMAKNNNWNSHVMNLAAQPWQDYLIEQAEHFQSRGFDGLFLDTLDSYTLFAQSESQQAQQQQALISVLRALHKVTPSLIFNRGFEVLERLPFQPQAVAAESLYDRYDPVNDQYLAVPKGDRQWLNGQFDVVKGLGIEAIAIDYLPADKPNERLTAAKRLLQEGFTPYVSDGLLTGFGVSTVVPVPKRILGFYDGNQVKMVTSHCHTRLAVMIEYDGYVPECRDIHKVNFNQLDMSRYAAAIMWLDESAYESSPSIQEWLKTQVGRLPLLFIDGLPTQADLLNQLSVRQNGFLGQGIHIDRDIEWSQGYYKATFNDFDAYQAWSPTSSDVQSLLTVSDNSGKSSSVIMKAKWGGAVLYPYPVKSLANGNDVWLIDGFKMMEGLLTLPKILAADATTESGLRILTSHVDGDGFPSKSWVKGNPYTAETLYQHVFKHYAIPQTISVIEGEISSQGLFPEQSAEMEQIARKIFRLPNVEIASHTFSHPFFWDEDLIRGEKQYGDHLDIPNYQLDYDKEIAGSINYINQKLAPENKKVKLLLWSGNADPTENIIEKAEQAKVLNVNGGNTYVVKGKNSLTRVYPTLAWYRKGIQVYAPTLNENLYTNLWTENFSGYSRAIETFQLLGAPRRLKSISIYYHMYSGSYPASVRAVEKLHDWAIAQPVTPLFLSEYAQRARSLYETGIAKTLDGKWQITSTGVNSIRVPNDLGFPTGDIAGWNDGPDGRYLILKQPRTQITLSKDSSTAMRLKSMNALLKQWQQSENRVEWAVSAHVPLQIHLAGVKRCDNFKGEALQQTIMKDGTLVLQSTHTGRLSGKFKCYSK